jgi:acetoin utilization deacetylase AcuC-like enzyme
MKRTGIFFHYQDGERLRDFPQALDGILDKDNVFLYDAFYPSKPPSSFDLEPIPEELLRQVHSLEMVEQVRISGVFEGALFSASGTVAASMRIWRGEIDNAFVFTGCGDHHAGRRSFGGGCYFNGAAIAIHQLRRHFGAKRLAIVDTDAHHGNGTWEIFEDDSEVLYMCFCSGSYRDKNNKVNIQVPWRVSDEEYLRLVEENFLPRAEAFEPEAVFWNWGYDGTQGDYGDIGLTPESHVRLAQGFKRAADQLCQGRLVVVLCGGSRRDLARRLIPQVISVLVGHEPQDILKKG